MVRDGVNMTSNTDNFACVLYLWPDHFLHLLVLYVWSDVGAHLHWAAPWRLLLPTRGKAVPRHEMDGEENHSEILLHIKRGWATQQGFKVADKSSQSQGCEMKYMDGMVT